MEPWVFPTRIFTCKTLPIPIGIFSDSAKRFNAPVDFYRSTFIFEDPPGAPFMILNKPAFNP
jgi:hypothetical protein